MDNNRKKVRRSLDSHIYTKSTFNEESKDKIMAKIKENQNQKKEIVFFEKLKPAMSVVIFLCMIGVGAWIFLLFEQDLVLEESPEKIERLHEQLGEVPNASLREEIRTNRELIEKFLEDEQFQQQVKIAQRWIWNEDELFFFTNVAMPERSFDVESQLLTLPEHILDFLLPSPINDNQEGVEILAQFYYDFDFRERVLLANEILPNLNKSHLKKLYKGETTTYIEADFYIEAGEKINIYGDSRFRGMFEAFIFGGWTEPKIAFADKLSEFTSVFYLRKDGSPSTADALKDIGEAKKWSSEATFEDFTEIYEHLRDDAQQKLKIFAELNPPVLQSERYNQGLTFILDEAKKTYEHIANDDMESVFIDGRYNEYISLAKELLVLNEILNSKVKSIEHDESEIFTTLDAVEFLLQQR